MVSRMSVIGRLALVLVACTACFGGGPTEVENRLWQLDFFATEYDLVTKFGRDCRLVNVLLDESTPIEPLWEASLSMQVQRNATLNLTAVHAIEEQNFDFRLEALDGDRVRLIVGGSYADTLEGQRDGQFGFRGDWECGETFPLADRQTILDAGYDPALPIPGGWTLGPIPPPG